MNAGERHRLPWLGAGAGGASAAGGQEDVDFAVIMTCRHDKKRLSATRGTTPALCHWDGELCPQRNIFTNKWLQRQTGDRRGRKTFPKNGHFVPHCWGRRPDIRPRREAHDRNDEFKGSDGMRGLSGSLRSTAGRGQQPANRAGR